MMSNFIIRAIVFTPLLTLLLTACSITSSNAFHPAPLSPGPVARWESKIVLGPGKLDIEFGLHPEASADIIFSRPENDFSSERVVRINFNDRNCSSGHQGFVTHITDKSEFLTSYFKNEATWNKTSRLVITWDGNQHLNATLNGETIHIDAVKKFKKISIVGYEHPIDIQKIQYTQQ